jgi:hypothetical protein
MVARSVFVSTSIWRWSSVICSWSLALRVISFSSKRPVRFSDSTLRSNSLCPASTLSRIAPTSATSAREFALLALGKEGLNHVKSLDEVVLHHVKNITSRLRASSDLTSYGPSGGHIFHAVQAAGSSTQNLLPFPGSDSTPQVPLMRCMARATIARPMPVPS